MIRQGAIKAIPVKFKRSRGGHVVVSRASARYLDDRRVSKKTWVRKEHLIARPRDCHDDRKERLFGPIHDADRIIGESLLQAFAVIGGYALAQGREPGVWSVAGRLLFDDAGRFLADDFGRAKIRLAQPEVDRARGRAVIETARRALANVSYALCRCEHNGQGLSKVIFESYG
jgi:hypothetical protein